MRREYLINVLVIRRFCSLFVESTLSLKMLRMRFVRLTIGVLVFSLMICQIFGRAANAIDYPDEDLIDLIFQEHPSTSTPQDCRCIRKTLCTNRLRKNSAIMEKFLGPHCPDPQDVCCKPNMAMTSLSPGTNTVTNPSPNPITCECAPISDCELYEGIDIRFGHGNGLSNLRLGECSDPGHICCDKLREPTSDTTTTEIYVRKQMSCGVRHEQGAGFKITTAGNEAQFGEFPWMVVIFKNKVKDGKEFLQFNGGGSLIHLKVVLTAAHIVYSHQTNPHLITVRAGEWDIKSVSETVPHRERVAEKIIVHPLYNSGNKAYDVALVILKDQFKFAENVDVICLPDTNTNVDQADCIAAGWGKESHDTDSYSNILKKVDLPLVPKADCQQKLSARRPDLKLDESLICAGGEKGVDTCYGDGGGPLFCPVPGSADIYQQVGITSFGLGCGEEIPSFYTNVPLVRIWIDSEVEKLGLQL